MMTFLIISGIFSVMIIALYFLISDYSSKDHPGMLGYPLRKFEKQDQQQFPPENCIVCTGSSVMQFWKNIEEDLAPLPVINRGIAGTKINEIVYHTERLILLYKPLAVLLYAGSNDIQGKSPKTAEQVRDGFIEFTKRIHIRQKDTQVYFISILPSASRMRWRHWPAIKSANTMIREFCETDERLSFIDAADAFLGSDGKPDPLYFKFDKIHLNSKGYEIWTSIIRPQLIPDNNRS